VARTNLEQQELYMKNAITRSLDDPILEDMPVVPSGSHCGRCRRSDVESVQDMIAEALKNRPMCRSQVLQLQNSELSRKTARNACFLQLSVYGFIRNRDSGLGSTFFCASSGTTSLASNGLRRSSANAFNYTSPEYQVGFQLSIPIAQPYCQGRPIPHRA
jgi:outer membrane protein TolC